MDIAHWLRERLSNHVEELEMSRMRHHRAWDEHVGAQASSFVTTFASAPPADIEEVRTRFPELPPQHLELLAISNGLQLAGFQNYGDYELLSADRIVRLRESDPMFISKWITAHENAQLNDSPRSADRRNPHVFNARALTSAIVLAASRGRGEEAILWIPAPVAEYWRVGAWEGCRRFSTIIDAVDHLLREVVSGLDAALS
jgi:hypothetical protein